MPVPRPALRAVALFAALSCLAAVACDRIALLAPAGSTISLTTTSPTLPLSGTTNIIAQVIEPAGTPPNKGTLVSFITTLGTIAPAEAETDSGGRAMVAFRAGTQSGTATISAVSGGVNTGTTGTVKILIGAASVTGIGLSAVPSVISAGGDSTITAIISDASGSAVVGVPVTFSTTAGSVNPSVVTTGPTGIAITTLSTTRTAEVTATAGITTSDGTTSTPAPSAKTTVTVEALPTASITGSGNPQVGTATTFTISAQPGANSTAGIESTFVTFGDGESASLGAASGTGIQVQHIYLTPGSKTATVTVTDTNGGRGSASTVVVVGGSNVVSVNLTSTQAANTPSPGFTTVTFTATVSPASISVTNYAWEFGDGNTTNTGGNQVTHPYSAGSGQKVVRVTVTTSTPGQTGSSTTTVIP